jgi:ubiquinone/menaquinone biosynthesis C-methylase UbiE
MTSPFSNIAPSMPSCGRIRRADAAARASMARNRRLFHAGDRILDLGCGTGDDAVHLMSTRSPSVWE